MKQQQYLVYLLMPPIDKSKNKCFDVANNV